jgi:hypothetical protein
MNNRGRCVAVLIVVVVVLSIVSLGADARGPHHHHGDEIGTHGTPPALSR